MSRESESFRQWLSSLSRHELIEAMKCTLQKQEYELLSEMVRLESPPPTPVHPRALGYRPRASKKGAQLDYHSRGLLRPQLFQWNERHFRGKQAFDVIARRKISPWGEIYSVGCTEEQRKADEILVDQTFLSREILVFRGEQSKRDIMRLLQVASRGHIWQCSVKSSIPFCASWLQPTERWFSLSFYLASRYHVALWETFTGKKRLPPRITYDKHILQRAIPKAVRLGLQQAMKKDAEDFNALRDSLLWEIVVEKNMDMTDLTFWDHEEDWPCIWYSLVHTKLRERGNSMSELQDLIVRELDGTLASEMQNALFEEASDIPNLSCKGKSKTKKKRKKRRPQRSMKAASLEMTEKEETVEPEHDFPIETMIRFPQNGTPPMERNRNIIMALTIMDDMIEAAFLQVGLKPTPPSLHSLPKENLKKIGKEVKKTAGKEIHKSYKGEKCTSDKDIKKNKKNGDVAIESTIERRSESTCFRSQIVKKLDTSGRIASGGIFEPSAFSPNFSSGIAWPLLVSSNKSAFQSFVPRSEADLPSHHFYRPSTTSAFSPTKTSVDDTLNGWPFMNRFQAREQSILSDFFREQEQECNDVEGHYIEDDDEKLMVASTTASVSSSTYRDPIVLADADDIDKAEKKGSTETPGLIDIIEENLKDEEVDDELDAVPISVSSGVSDPSESSPPKVAAFSTNADDSMVGVTDDDQSPPLSPTMPRSPSPEAPLTPPPTLSPILVSLADLRDMKRGLSLTPERLTSNKEVTGTRTYAAAASGSLPSSPTSAQGKRLGANWSRDDIRMKFFRDDQNIRSKRKAPQPQRSSSELQPSYRAAAVKSLARPIASSKVASLDFRSQVMASLRREVPRDSCARSETALEKHREDPSWQGDFRRTEEFDNKSMTKDETTTITSALSQREPEEIATLREERNTFRDLCLTLGAEVSKLKAVLAAQQAIAVATPFEFQDPFGHPMYQASSFDPQGMQPFFYGNKRGQRLGPMSDAGVHRAGDHESQVSEDDNFELMSRTRMDIVRQMSSNATAVGSDASVDFNNSSSALQSGQISSMPLYDSIPVQGLQSRLAKDMLRFLDATRVQLRKQDSKRRTAVERFTRLVTAIWPRAQVKLYGSHVSGLCLPSSDLDFVICLPAVHKNAPALAPGVLEGRNAINESSQKLLARELKGESWIDPRSIKLIERTVVPVIKVSTKDTRAKVIQLDISFDSPEHHGLEANALVAQILEELPLIRPLMLILKQFLLDRGLLTAYTGGLSSYCLFLMVARYLQEQPRSISDCGSLLMGFLDFYGNFFDPRATGISVRRRQYFVRPNNYRPGNYTVQPPIWNVPMAPSPQHVNVTSPSSVGPHDFLRRNSFSSDTGSVDGVRRGHRPPRFQSGSATSHRYKAHKVVPPTPPLVAAAAKTTTTTSTRNSVPTTGPTNQDHNFGHGRPFTFDPLFVEDLLSSGNNVGRNAFRIFQVQRAFSDAHRALVASLEWDIQSSGELNDGGESYPLLKCLLQSEDVLYEL